MREQPAPAQGMAVEAVPQEEVLAQKPAVAAQGGVSEPEQRQALQEVAAEARRLVEPRQQSVPEEAEIIHTDVTKVFCQS